MQALTHQTGPFFRRFNPAFFGSVSRATFEPDTWREADAIVGQSSGRGVTYFVRHGQATLVLKHYRRGGLVGKFIDDSYLFTGWEQTRAIREFDLLTWMVNHHLPVPTPVAAQVRRHGPIYRADLITERVARAKDLFAILSEDTLPEHMIKRIGATIANFHHHGIHHADLNIRNILIDDAEKVWLIDFDRGTRREDAPREDAPREDAPREDAPRDRSRWRAGNLKRLKISFDKEVKRAGLKWKEDHWQQLLAGYAGQS